MIPPPTEPWEEITMDFIVKLPVSQHPVSHAIYDSILVVVDKLTKYAHFIPVREDYTAEDLSYIILDNVIRLHGIPARYITDRDKLFKSTYWKTLTSAMGTKHKMSTAYHPQTDGQTERSNQELEIYLRHFVNKRHDNWVSLLPLAEMAINNRKSSTTGFSPAMANYGRQLSVSRVRIENEPNAESALQRIQKINETTKEVHENILKSNEKITIRENKKRKEGPQLKRGDKVYLHTKNLKTTKPSKKLDNIRVGPFLIDEVRGPVSYKLKLPNDARVHPVFHISLLEPADPATPLQETFHYKEPDEQTWLVEKILKHKNNQYLVKWKDFPESDNTWEPRSGIQHTVAFKEYQRSRQVNLLYARGMYDIPGPPTFPKKPPNDSKGPKSGMSPGESRPITARHPLRL